MNKVEFCDLECKYARFPKSDAVDGSRSCGTFVAPHCLRRKKLVHKNLPCRDKVGKKMTVCMIGNERPIMTFYSSWQKMP